MNTITIQFIHCHPFSFITLCITNTHSYSDSPHCLLTLSPPFFTPQQRQSSTPREGNTLAVPPSEEAIGLSPMHWQCIVLLAVAAMITTTATVPLSAIPSWTSQPSWLLSCPRRRLALTVSSMLTHITTGAVLSLLSSVGTHFTKILLFCSCGGYWTWVGVDVLIWVLGGCVFGWRTFWGWVWTLMGSFVEHYFQAELNETCARSHNELVW